MSDDRDLDRIERLLREAADDLHMAQTYPPTPPIADRVRRQLVPRRAPTARLRTRLIRAVALTVIVFVMMLLLFPDVRQTVARFFGLETVRIERIATVPAPSSTAPQTPQPGFDPAGLTTLAEARARAGFEIRLPTYPAGQGDPTHVFFQDFGNELNGAQQIILEYPDFRLYIAQDFVFLKSISDATLVEEVKIDGRAGLWFTGGEHLVQMQDRSGALRIDSRRVDGNVLAWEAGAVTYRIETQLPLAQAIRIAESLR